MAIFYTCHGLNLVPKNAQANCIVHSHQNYMFPPQLLEVYLQTPTPIYLAQKKANS